MNVITKLGLQVTVSPDGDITAAHLADLRDDLIVLAGDFTQIIIDMSHVEFIDSAGIVLLISTQNILGKIYHELMLINVSDDIMEVLTRMRLDKHFPITDRNA